MSDRVDFSFPGGVYTKKPMPNGEVRTRIKLHEGPVHSLLTTRMHVWDWADKIPWQEPHFHKGLTEHYLICEGWAVFGERNREFGDGRYARKYHGFVKTANLKEVVSFGPNEPHMVLLGPDAVIVTLLIGEPMGNPEKQGNDWWPAEDDMDPWIRRWPITELQRAVYDAGGGPRSSAWPFPRG